MSIGEPELIKALELLTEKVNNLKPNTFSMNFLIPAIISAIVSTATALFVANKTSHGNNKRHIENRIDKLLEISMQYPYLENDEYCNTWHQASPNDNKRMRYENYCCLVFNLIEDIWKIHKGNHEDINKVLHIKELAIRHSKWWNKDKENISGYTILFRCYINKLMESK